MPGWARNDASVIFANTIPEACQSIALLVSTARLPRPRPCGTRFLSPRAQKNCPSARSIPWIARARSAARTEKRVYPHVRKYTRLCASHFSLGSKVTRRKFVRGEGEPGDEAKCRGQKNRWYPPSREVFLVVLIQQSHYRLPPARERAASMCMRAAELLFGIISQ